MGAGNLLTGIVVETLRSVAEAGPFVLLGLLAAGLLHEFLDTKRIVAALGGRDLKSILTATFLGAPLPLCSCGVLPAALSLRKKGASREATIAFLISTPETGIDSIALTYGLLGPFMAVARPLAAIATGIAAGLVSLIQPEQDGSGEIGPPHPHVHQDSGGEAPGEARPSMGRRLLQAVRYGFVTLLDDLTFWLVIAFLATGVLTAALPPDFFQRYLPNGFASLVVMALLGIPTYVCASASTPVAAAMLAKGLSPGAALVFMLTGPATNASTVGVVARLFGRRFVATYIGAIFGVALAAGVLVNLILGSTWTPPAFSGADGPGSLSSLWMAAGALLLMLMWQSLARTGLRPGVAELRAHFTALTEWSESIDWRTVHWKSALRIVLPVLAVLYLAQGVVVVGPGEEGLRRTFGKVSAARLDPGLHLCWPPPLGRVDIVATKAVRTVEIGYTNLRDRDPAPGPRSYPRRLPSFGGAQTTQVPEGSAFVAGDETVVAVTGVVQYQVADSARFQLGVDHPDSVVRAVARAALVEAIARTPIDALYSSARGEVEGLVLGSLRGSPTVAAIGVEPISFNLLYVHAPGEVHAAFRDVASAAEDTTTIRNKALVEAEGSVRLAHGEAARLVAEAESYRVQQVERARGNSAAFVPLAAEDRRARGVTRDRLYLEAMERVFGRFTKLIKAGPRNGTGLEMWVTPADGTSTFLSNGFVPGSPVPSSDDEEGSLPRPSSRPRD